MTRFSIDLAQTPFSRRGSYFAVSRRTEPDASGLYLRTVHGDARQRELLRLLVGSDATPVAMANPGRLRLESVGGAAELALDGSGRAVLRVNRGSLTLKAEVRSAYDVLLAERPGTWRYVASGANRNYRITAPAGTGELEVDWDGVKNREARLSFTVSDAPITIVIDEFAITPPAPAPADLDAVAAAAEHGFADWLARHGTLVGDPALDAATVLAAYVTWSALVPAGGMLRRESMLMSKNDMAHIWAWDHCFNAIALAQDPDAAADQLLTLFDHQDAAGGLPDHIDDARVQPNFVKPPIHGWAIGQLMDRGGLSDEMLDALHAPLARWTDWWFSHRVYGDDGVPSYNHGNDSGWDNSTVFAPGVPLQSPDLMAFLAVQQQVLGRMSDWLGRSDGDTFRQRAAATIDTMLRHFWRGDRFVARDTRSGRDITADSLLTLMPLVLGPLLPREMFAASVDRLLAGGYLTDHGIATEPVASPHYVADGYWRGPIWAPTTMLLIDGLRQGGRNVIADDLARRFLMTCAGAGMAENFDALTGAGLRDRSMTWTASVYLTLLADLQSRGTLRATTDGDDWRPVMPRPAPDA